MRWSQATLLIGDLESCKLSEVPWSGSGSEKFIFENPAVCMVCPPLPSNLNSQSSTLNPPPSTLNPQP
jgi:hypothetical protein